MEKDQRAAREALRYCAQSRLEALLRNELELREMGYFRSASVYLGRWLEEGVKGYAEGAGFGRSFGESGPGVTFTLLLSAALLWWGRGDGTQVLGSAMVMALSAAALGIAYAAVVSASPGLFLLGECAVGFLGYQFYLMDSLVRAVDWVELAPAALAGPGLVFFFLVYFRAEESRDVSGALYAVPAGLLLGTLTSVVCMLWGVAGATTRFLWWPVWRRSFRPAERCIAERTLRLLRESFSPRLVVPVRREDYAGGCRQAFVQTCKGTVLVDFRAPGAQASPRMGLRPVSATGC
ncbi:MAG: hypothetical protein HY319_29075 [Armatimonadetes bacterium]|nr:hypothetical protein [Armatimonadota bacterium]